MALVNADLTNPEDLQRPVFVPLEPGVYTMEINGKPLIRPSKQPSKDGVTYDVVEFELKDLETGKTVREYISRHPSSTWKLNQLIASAGIQEVGDKQYDLDDLDGTVVKVELGQRTYTKNDGTPGLANEVRAYLYE